MYSVDSFIAEIRYVLYILKYLHKHLLTSGLLANLDKRKEENFFPWNISKKSEYIPISKTLKDQKFLDQIILERLSSMAS